MKKSVKVLAGVTAFLLIIGILWFANGLLDNPISKTIANNTSKEYISENYSNMKLNVSDAYYNFKTGGYYVEIKSPTSKDTYFYLSISPFGKITYDSYEIDVADRNIFDKENIPFYAIDFTLEKPRNEEGTPNSDDTSIIVEHFLYEDIYEENLEQRISKAEKDLKKYYEKMDLIKKEQELNTK